MKMQDADMYGEWGLDYLKYDWCSYGGVLDRDLDKDLTACLPWRFKGEGIQLPVESHLRLWAIICVSSPGTLFITCVSMVWEMCWKWGDGRWRPVLAHD